MQSDSRNQPINGITLYGTHLDWPVMRLHEFADPEKTEEWQARERARYNSDALFEQEHNIKFGVGGGERLLRDILLARFNEIVIRDPDWRPQPNWEWGAGFDYGQSSPTAWLPICRDHFGVHYAVAEHYQSGVEWTPQRHAESMISMCVIVGDKLVPIHELVGKNTIADPSTISPTHVQSHGPNASISELYEKAFLDPFGARITGYPCDGISMQPGLKGDDMGFVNRLRQMWSAPDPLFKIVLHPGLSYNRKREGTYSQGCPNLIWELLGIRRRTLSASQLDTRSPLDQIVEKNNHQWDCLRYYFSARPGLAKFTSEELWLQKASAFVRNNSDMAPLQSLNAQIMMHREFEKENKEPEFSTWR